MSYEVGQKVRVLDKTIGTRKQNSGSWKAIEENNMIAEIFYISKQENENWVELVSHKDSHWVGEYSLDDIAPLNETLEGVEEL